MIFISSKFEKVEITPLIIITKLEQYDYRRSGGHRRGDAGGVVRRVVVHQLDAVVEPAVRDIRGSGSS